MAISATMSVWGLYQWDNTLFDNLNVPEGINKDDLCDNILIESASLEVLYASPDFLKQAIGVWSERRSPIWAKMLETTGYIYNPIHNYDRTETHTETVSKETANSDTKTVDSEKTRSDTRTVDTDTTSSTSGSSTSTDSKTSYESNSFKDTGKNTRSGSDQSTGTEDTTETLSGTDTEDTTETLSGTGSEDTERTLTIHASGNVGIMSTQEMIERQRKIIDFDVVQIITTEFIDKFCIGVY